MIDRRKVRDWTLGGLGALTARSEVPRAALGGVAEVRECSPGIAVVTVGPPHEVEVMQMGLLRLDGRRVLQLDYSTREALRSYRRSGMSVPSAIALWSHNWLGYYHWLIDALPKVVLLQDVMPEVLTGATLCYPRSPKVAGIASESLELLGLRDVPVIDTRQAGSVRAERATGVTVPGFGQAPPALVSLRNRLGHLGCGLGPRLYVQRTGVRRVANEDRILPLLERRGFQVLTEEPRTLVEQIGIFREAEFVVAPHGGALANLVWCQPGTRVLELADAGYCPTYFEAISARADLRYQRLVFGDRAASWRNTARDITVEPERLATELDRMLADRS